MENNLLSAWTTVGSIVLAIVILLIMITVHEFGHYIVGKILKFKINEFAIGFGPAIFKKKRKKADEIFSIRIFPLGGFCSFAGEDGLEEEENKSKAPMSEGEPFQELFEVPQTADMDTILLTEPTEELSPKEEEIVKKEPTEEASPKEEDPVKEEPLKEGRHKRKEAKPDDGLFTHKKPWRRILVLLAGAFMNYLLALVLILMLFGIYGQPMIKIGAIIEHPDYTQNLQADDIILGANGKKIYLASDLLDVVNGKPDGYLVNFRVSRLQEDGKRKEVDQTVQLRAVDRDGNKLESGKIEVSNSSSLSPALRALGVDTEEREDGSYYIVENVMYHFGFFETIGRSFVYSFKIAGSIFRVIGDLFTGKLGLTSLGGPVTTITTTAEVVSVGGFQGFLEIAALIGVNLAVFNLLPIPALDGSKIVFTIIEWIRGKPINRKVEAIIHVVGIVLLFGFAILVDVLHFV